LYIEFVGLTHSMDSSTPRSSGETEAGSAEEQPAKG
jgi:hypothetical protein